MFEKLISLFSGEGFFSKGENKDNKPIKPNTQPEKTYSDAIEYIRDHFIILLEKCTNYYNQYINHEPEKSKYIHSKIYLQYFQELVDALEVCYQQWGLEKKNAHISIWKDIICTRPLLKEFQDFREYGIALFRTEPKFFTENKDYLGAIEDEYFDYLFGTDSMGIDYAFRDLSPRLMFEFLVFFDFFCVSLKKNNPNWSNYTQKLVLNKFFILLKSKSQNNFNLLNKIFHIFIVEGLTFCTSFSKLERGKFKLPFYTESTAFKNYLRFLINHFRTGVRYYNIKSRDVDVIHSPKWKSNDFSEPEIKNHRRETGQPFTDPTIFKDVDLKFLY